MGSTAAKGRAMPKGEVFGAIEASSGIKKRDVKTVFGALESLIPAQLKASGKFTIPGITMIKLKKKPATKAGKRMAFGKEVFVKAKPAKTLVKCYTVKALKDEFSSPHVVHRRRCDARSWVWGSPAASLSDGRS